MFEFIRIAQIVFQLMPVVIIAIKAVEDAIPGEGKGEAKLAVIRETLEGIYNTTTDTGIAFASVWKVMENQIKILVQAFNREGWE